MRLGDDEWRVLNFGSETVPRPGWPPTLHEENARADPVSVDRSAYETPTRRAERRWT